LGLYLGTIVLLLALDIYESQMFGVFNWNPVTYAFHASNNIYPITLCQEPSTSGKPMSQVQGLLKP
jgi:hypothetical protein